MSLARSIVELRSIFEKESENPDQYYQRVGKCPPGFSFDGKGCVKGGADPEKPAAVKKGEPGGADPKTPAGPEKPALVEPAKVEPAPKPGDMIRAPTDKDGWTEGDHLEKAAEFLKIGGSDKIQQIAADAKAWLQKRWEGELAAIAGELDNLSALAVAHTSKRNEVEDKAAAELEESPEEYAKKLREAVPPEMVQDTQDAIDSFADEEDEDEKKKKKEKVEDYAEQSAASLIFGLLAVAFAPITAMALVGNWMAKKVGINIFGKSDEAAGDVVKNLDELDNMIVQEVISLLHQGTSSKDMEAAVQQHIDEEGEMPKQESFILDSIPLNVGGQLNEWSLNESKPVKKWSEIGDGVQNAMNHFVREHGRFLEINGPEGDFENNGEINAGFSWELKRQFRQKELGDKNATMSGEAGFKLREVGSSQVADADSRAWGSAPWGGADAQEQRKSFRGKTRGDVLMQVFKWLAKVVQSQSQEVENNLHDARDQPYR